MFLPLIFTVVALDALSFSMAIICFAPYIFSLGGTQLYLGILTSLTSLVTLIWNPIAGSLSDSLGRKTMLIRCLAICLAGNFLTLVSSSLSIIFLARILTSFGVPLTAILKSMIDDNVEPAKKLDVMTKMMSIAPISFMFGSLISGFVSELENGMTYIFGFVTVVFVINIIIISLVDVKEQTKKSGSKSNVKDPKQIISNLRNINWSKLWDIFTVKLICEFALNVIFFTTGHILTVKFGIAGKLLGFFFFFKSIIMIATNLNMKRLNSLFYSNDRLGLTRLLHCTAVLTISTLGTSLSSSMYAFIFWQLPMAFVQSLLETTVTETVLTRVTDEEKGAALGAFDSTFFLAGLVAPAISGVLTDYLGDSYSMLICSFLPSVLGVSLVLSQRIKLKVN